MSCDIVFYENESYDFAFVDGHVTKMWFLKLWIIQILHLNFKENVDKMMW